MRSIKKLIGAMLLSLMVASSFTGCGQTNTSTSTDTNQPAQEATQEASEEKKDEKKPVIGFSLPTLQEERWARDKEAMENYAKSKGIDLLVQIADMDAQKQANQCENLISQGIDVLILAPHDASSAAAIVESARVSNVPVISYDRLVMDTDLDLYISFDNVKVGEIQGKYLTEHLDKGNIVWLAGAPTDNNAKLFKQGAAKYLQPKIDSGDYKVILEQDVIDWKPDNALKIMEQALTLANNDIQGVLAPNDGTAGGCIQAMNAQGITDKVVITGQDAELAAAQRIVNGEQDMTVFKDTRNLATAALDAAIAMANGEKVETNGAVTNNNKMDVPSLLLEPVAVDKDNIDEILIDSGYLKREDVYQN